MANVSITWTQSTESNEKGLKTWIGTATVSADFNLHIENYTGVGILLNVATGSNSTFANVCAYQKEQVVVDDTFIGAGIYPRTIELRMVAPTTNHPTATITTA